MCTSKKCHNIPVTFEGKGTSDKQFNSFRQYIINKYIYKLNHNECKIIRQVQINMPLVILALSVLLHKTDLTGSSLVRKLNGQFRKIAI